MKKITFLMAICLMFSINAFSQISLAKQPNAPHSKQNSLEWNDTKQVPKKWNGMKTQSNVAKMSILHQKKQPIAANSQKATKQYLDSVAITEGDENGKMIFLYDANGNHTGHIGYYWDGSDWVITQKIEWTYDGNGNIIEDIYYEWNGIDELNYKTIYTYDSNKNLTEEISYRWDGSDWVEEFRKVEYKYDGSGNLTERISYYRDGSGWVGIFKEKYTYDGSGNLIEEIFYGWVDSNWIESSKHEYVYDGNGNLTEEIYYRWDDSNWVGNSKGKYIYDGSGNLIEEIFYGWVDSNWIESSKHEYVYDGNGNLTEEIYYRWDDSNWIEQEKIEYKYDVNGNQTKSIVYSWNGSDWVEWGKCEYKYDLSYSISDLVFPDDYFYPAFTGMRTEAKCYSWDGTDWATDYTHIYYWSSKDVGIVETNNYPSLWVYPNPTTGQLRIQSEELRIENVVIHDIFGKIQKIENWKVDNTIDISHLPAGIYFAKIHTDAGEVVKKVLKE